MHIFTNFIECYLNFSNFKQFHRFKIQKLKIISCLYLKSNSIFYFIDVYHYRRIIGVCSMFFKSPCDIFKVMLNSSFHVGAYTLNLLFLYDFFMFFHVQYMAIFVKAICLSLLFTFIWYVRLRHSVWWSDILLFLEFINLAFIFASYLYRIYCIVIYFFSNFIFSIQRIYDLPDFIY